jgi:large subunit ribosomal protein L15
MPKYKGFNQSRKIENDAVNVNTLEKEFKAGEVVSVDTLKEKGIIKKNSQGVKILGKGEIKIKLNIEGVAVSAAAKEKIMKAGGTIK